MELGIKEKEGMETIMKKKITFMLFFLFLTFFVGTKTASAAYESNTERFLKRNASMGDLKAKDNEDLPRVVDYAKLLSDYEAEKLEEKIKVLREKWDFDLVILTANTLSGYTPMEYADDYYDYVGYGGAGDRNGLLLLVSMEDRDWWISTRGYGIKAFTDAGIQFLGEQLVSKISDGHYAAGFDKFVDWADQFLTEAEEGTPYNINHMPRGPKPMGMITIFSVIAAVMGAFVVLAVMKSKLTSVRMGTEANNYVVKDSLVMAEQKDTFLYKNVTKVKRQTSSGGGGSGTHRSSSGASHGGGGGKF